MAQLCLCVFLGTEWFGCRLWVLLSAGLEPPWIRLVYPFAYRVREPSVFPLENLRWLAKPLRPEIEPA